MSISRRRALGLAGAGSAVVAFGVTGEEAEAAGNPLGGEATFGSIGVTSAQVARLSAVNYDSPGAAESGGIAGGGCIVALEIHRLSGEVLASQRFQLAPGQGAFLDATAGRQTPREQIYGVVKHIVQRSAPSGDHMMGATLEIFDIATGKTTALLLPAVQKIREAANRSG